MHALRLKIDHILANSKQNQGPRGYYLMKKPRVENLVIGIRYVINDVEIFQILTVVEIFLEPLK
jgi:hypothetical protein